MDFKPKTFEEIAGQEKIKSVLKTFIDFSKKTDTIVPSCLFLGRSGLGKTSISHVLANEVGGNLHTVNAPQVKDSKELFDILSKIRNKDVFLIEEIHSLSRKVSDSLLVAIEDFYYVDKGRKYSIKPFTLIGATTDEGLIVSALRNRFKFRARFEEYTEDELVEIAYLVASRMGFTLNKKIAQRISRVSRGIPREVAQNTEFIRMFMVANELTSINTEKFYEIVSMRGFNKDGLRPHDIDYLKSLEYETLSLNVLSSKIGVDRTTIQEDVEPYLLKLGLIEISTSGRSLSQKGLDYVREC
jgi:Holliday junction DNA helicase RuvB